MIFVQKSVSCTLDHRANKSAGDAQSPYQKLVLSPCVLVKK